MITRLDEPCPGATRAREGRSIGIKFRQEVGGNGHVICRDREWWGADVGAWCLSWWNGDDPMGRLSSMQEQAKTHTGQGSSGDYHEKFESGSYRTLAGIAGIDCTQNHSCKRRESKCPPSGLWQGEEQWNRWNKAANHKGDPNLCPLQPWIDVRVFYHP